MSLWITSSAFAPNASIPPLYTCEGNDVSPPLAFGGAPAGTKSLALIVDDPDAPDPSAPQMTWVHWVLTTFPRQSPVSLRQSSPRRCRPAPAKGSTIGAAPATAGRARQPAGTATSISSTRSIFFCPRSRERTSPRWRRR